MAITILTPTYNRKDSLNKLYLTLSAQTNKEFEWVIVDDGSTDGTDKMITGWNLNQHGFIVRYYKKENGGKSRAVNFGLDVCSSSEFVLIVDDDEELYPNATDIISSYVEKYRNTNCVGMEFLRNDKNKNPIANYILDKDLIMSVQERKNKHLEIDGYTGYFIQKLGNHRFPEFEGERYVGPGVLQMLASQKHDLVWPCVALGETEYLLGGITSQGRKLRLRNPKGMIVYCDLLQNHKSGLLIRLKYSVMGYAYATFIQNKRERREVIGNSHFYKSCFIPGILLGAIWKAKYFK